MHADQKAEWTSFLRSFEPPLNGESVRRWNNFSLYTGEKAGRRASSQKLMFSRFRRTNRQHSS